MQKHSEVTKYIAKSVKINKKVQKYNIQNTQNNINFSKSLTIGTTD